MDTLTEEEKQFLKKMDDERKKHNEAQKKYRLNHLDKVSNYNKEYFKLKQDKKLEIKSKILKAEPIKIDVEKIAEKPIINKRRRGAKKQEEALNIIPSYINRKDVLELSTIDDYIKKTKIVHKIFKNKALSQNVISEIKKLLNDSKDVNERLILDEMDYINDIKNTIDKLREHYKNDNSFKTYLNILVVITSHLKTIDNEIYQTLTKTGIYVNKAIETKRKNNELDIKDEGKIIDLNRDLILSNIEKLDDVEEQLIFGLYTLQPSRRLEYRNMKITTETDISKLNDINYIIISSSPYKFVFNDYKTYKKYNKQIIDVDNDLMKIIDKYISIKGLKQGDYLFSLKRNKKEIYDEGAFSNKVGNTFKKIYGINITIRFIRISWSVYIQSLNISTNKKEAIIEKMAHSYEENQKKYFKLKK